MEHQTSRGTFRVVVNGEEQYSIWALERALPPGWREAGRTGPREECLAYIEQVWTDMRPKSLRDRMARPPVPAQTANGVEPELA